MSSANREKVERIKLNLRALLCSTWRGLVSFCLLPLAFLLSGCRMDMQDQPRYEAYEKTEFFDDNLASRIPPEGTVARGQLRDNSPFYTGRSATATTGGAQSGQAGQAPLVDTIPVPVNEQMLLRGQDRYNAYCAVCHGMTGKGDGMVVRRGFRAPPPFTNERLLEVPVGHFFDVITNGFGAMPDYAAQISVEDRWAVVAYIKALQLSQRAPVADVPASERQKLEAGGQK